MQKIIRSLFFSILLVFSHRLISLESEDISCLSSNAVTLQSYEACIRNYIEGTPSELCDHLKDWIHLVLSKISLNAQIIEIGSAFGRDSAYMESLGFKVEKTDATEAFVSYLQERGSVARKFNILSDSFNAQYDLIFANAVFLHFTPQEFNGVLQKIHAHLKNEGILAFSVKKGEGEEWSTAKLGQPRYFCYWSKEKLKQKLESFGFQVISIVEAEPWIYVVSSSLNKCSVK